MSEANWQFLEALAAQKIRHLSRREILSLRNARGTISLQAVPSFNDANKFRGYELRKIVRMCPYSQYFGITIEMLHFKFPKKRHVLKVVHKMIINWVKERSDLEQVPERAQSMEESPIAQNLN